HIWYVKGTPSRLGLLLNISPRDLEPVLYFASYLVTDVDDEKRNAAVEDIKALSQETIDELNEEAKGQIEEILSNSDLDLSNLEEGATTLIESVEFETRRQLAELKTSYLDIEENLKNRQG